MPGKEWAPHLQYTFPQSIQGAIYCIYKFGRGLHIPVVLGEPVNFITVLVIFSQQ